MMNKKTWEESLEKLKKLLVLKKEELEKLNNDIEEIEYSIECYENKIKTYI